VVDKATLTYIVLFRCFCIVFALMLIIRRVVYIFMRYWRSIFRLAAYLVSQLLLMYILIYFLGVTPKPLLAATVPEGRLNPELIHARITAILTNWPQCHEQHIDFLKENKVVFSTYETRYLTHLQGIFEQRFNLNAYQNHVRGIPQVRSTQAIEPVHQIYSYFRCPLPAQFRQDRHLSTSNLINRRDVFFEMKDPALIHQTLTSLSI